MTQPNPDFTPLTIAQQTELRLLGLETTPDAWIAIDDSQRIVDANQHTAQMFGYPLRSLIGMPLTNLMPERFRERHESHVRKFRTDPKDRTMAHGMDFWALDQGGTEFKLKISIAQRSIEGRGKINLAFFRVSNDA